MIGIVDYGASNLRSIENAFDRLGEECSIVSAPDQIVNCDRLVLPGTGAAGPAIGRLAETGLLEALDEFSRRHSRPMLGICLGMQLLAETLDEFGVHRGLGWTSGHTGPIERLIKGRVPVPHMGWGLVHVSSAGSLLGSRDAFYYFAHSNILFPSDDRDIVGTSEYLVEFPAAVQIGSIFAVQFHPEKSQRAGEILLERFAKWDPS